MSVLLETSAGDIVIDLLVDHAPKLCENFLKLCKTKYYNFSPVHSVQKDFSLQTGDPLGPLSKDSDGGCSIWGRMSGNPSDRTFQALFHPKLKHLERGTVSMATVPVSADDPETRVAASQFIITLGEDTDYLDGKAAIFGKVVEGFDALDKINTAVVDDKGYPLVDIRIKHTVILDDPYPDPPGLREPSASPPPSDDQLKTIRIADEAALLEDDGIDEEELEKRRREREANAQALTLEMMGDLPFAEVKPPENVLFVCKLNPVTGDEDLELIFGRFGKILSCEVIRDHKTGDSLQYAFIEYEDKASCEGAYFKMQGVLIDDRRIHVDFSQSVSKLSDVWRSDTNNKRRANAGRGGWGGVRDLEKRRQYRAEGERTVGKDYGLVYSNDEMKDRHELTGGDGRKGNGRPPEDESERNDRAEPRSERGGAQRGGDHRGGDHRGGDHRGGDQRGGGHRGGSDKGGSDRGGGERGGRGGRGGDRRQNRSRSPRWRDNGRERYRDSKDDRRRDNRDYERERPGDDRRRDRDRDRGRDRRDQGHRSRR